MLTEYNITADAKNCKNKSESDLTTGLSWLCYEGAGETCLGFRFADRELQDDGSWKILPSRWDHKLKRFFANYDHPEYWRPKNKHWRSSSLLTHLQGQHRGLVVDDLTTSVPFLASDLDRHHGEDSTQHILRVIRVLRECVKLFSQLRWLAEVNPRNGSAKLFGFGRKPLPISEAKEMGEELHKVVVQITGNPNTEVFPYNLKQVLLPFRSDKITIVGDGVLGKVQRYKKINGKRVYYDAYSMSAFETWWRGHKQCCERTLQRVLCEACGSAEITATSTITSATISKPVNRLEQLRDEAYREAMGWKEAESLQPSLSLRDKDAPLGRGINGGLGPDGVVPRASDPQTLDRIRTIANAFDRKRQFAQWLSRQLRRVPTVDELLGAYKANKMFSGSWDDGLGKRRADFREIVKYVAKTFDPALCGMGKSDRPELNKKIMLWRGRMTSRFLLGKTFSTVINQTRNVDEYGNVHVSVGKTRHGNGQQLSYVMGIVSYVMQTSKDGSIRRDSVQGWWQDLAAEGKLPKWSTDTWIAYRQILEQVGFIKVNHNYSHRGHISKTAKITFDDGPLVGTVYTYPSETIISPPTSIMVVTHSSPNFGPPAVQTPPRPPPRGQPPPIVRFSPSTEERNSWF